MKNVGLILLMFILSTSVQAQKKYFNVHNTPAQIEEFVKQHFGDHEIIYTKKKTNSKRTKYKTRLDNKVKLEFDENFRPKEIEAKNGLPNSVVSEKIRDYVKQNYPNQKIVEWERKKDQRQEVELANGIELIFDRDDNFLKID